MKKETSIRNKSKPINKKDITEDPLRNGTGYIFSFGHSLKAATEKQQNTDDSVFHFEDRKSGVHCPARDGLTALVF